MCAERAALDDGGAAGSQAALTHKAAALAGKLLISINVYRAAFPAKYIQLQAQAVLRRTYGRPKWT